MTKKSTRTDNFLEMIPVKNEKINWEMTDDGLVQVIIPRDGMLDKIVRLFFKTPEVMRIDLDAIGSCVWKAIDNKKNMEEIAETLQNEFGNEVHPLYERLGTYINLLRNNGFIKIKKVRD